MSKSQCESVLAPLPRGKLTQAFGRWEYVTDDDPGFEENTNLVLIQPGPCFLTMFSAAIEGAGADVRVLLFDAPSVAVAQTQPFAKYTWGPLEEDSGILVMPEELFTVGGERIPAFPFDYGLVVGLSTTVEFTSPGVECMRLTLRGRT